MTTVVATHELIAADSCLDSGNGAAPTVKIARISGSLWGFAGSSTDALKFLRWVRGGFRANTRPDFAGVEDADFDVLQVTPAGKIVLWTEDLEPISLTTPYHALGSGGNFALGALDAGASVTRALEIASNRDQNTRAPFDILYLKAKKANATRS